MSAHATGKTACKFQQFAQVWEYVSRMRLGRQFQKGAKKA
jgi:hypothetical protein